jgi:hypothetical protein
MSILTLQVPGAGGSRVELDLPDGWTLETVTAERERHGVDARHWPLALVPGVVGWGVPHPGDRGVRLISDPQKRT